MRSETHTKKLVDACSISLRGRARPPKARNGCLTGPEERGAKFFHFILATLGAYGKETANVIGVGQGGNRVVAVAVQNTTRWWRARGAMLSPRCCCQERLRGVVRRLRGVERLRGVVR